ncbi:unnamed protein product [Albugo candida]|uniref:Uncharacterized protein n=1 Tax=Albugo candida TaxID=65357 RepID=A0A024G6J4_9STRA|nr:unnamed protein product [Albugo candida]|eukprot:CCI41910.1 unnamed protein product [Albugo candida]
MIAYFPSTDRLDRLYDQKFTSAKGYLFVQEEKHVSKPLEPSTKIFLFLLSVTFRFPPKAYIMDVNYPECEELKERVKACYGDWFHKLWGGSFERARCDNETHDFRECIQDAKDRRQRNNNRYGSRDDRSWVDSAADTVRDAASRVRDRGKEWNDSLMNRTQEARDRFDEKEGEWSQSGRQNRSDYERTKDSWKNRARQTSDDLYEWKEDVKDRARRKADDFGRDKDDWKNQTYQTKENWKERGRQSSDDWRNQAKDSKRSMEQKAHETRDYVSDKAENASNQVNETAEDWTSQVKNKAGELRDKFVDNLPRELKGDVSQKSPDEIKDSLKERTSKDDNSWFKK